MRVLSVPPHCQFKASGMELAEYFHIHDLVDYTLCIKGCIKVHSLPVSILGLAPVIPSTLLSLSGVFEVVWLQSSLWLSSQTIKKKFNSAYLI